MYKINTEFHTPMKLVWLIKTYFNKTYSKVHKHRRLSYAFLMQKGLKQ